MKEHEWKKFKKLKDVCLDRFCERVLADANSIITTNTKTNREKYYDLYKLIEDEDKRLATAFDGLSRNTAFMQLFLMHQMGLVEERELDEFETETSSKIRSLGSEH